MKFTSIHVHTHFCDGVGEPDEFCREAETAGLAGLGFSAHAPLASTVPFLSDWHLSAARLDEYRAAIQKCTTSYAGKLPIYCGLEADYIAGCQSPRDYAYYGLDYLIGSIHCVVPPCGASAFFERAGKLLCVDGSPEERINLIDMFFEGDVWHLVEAYWEQTFAMIDEGGFDVLGHAGLLAKNNRPGSLPSGSGGLPAAGSLAAAYCFDEASDRYLRYFARLAEALAGGGIVVEINTGGITRGCAADTYPPRSALKLLRERGVPVTINADAHQCRHVVSNYSRAVDNARAAGYREIMLFAGRAGGACVWKPQPL